MIQAFPVVSSNQIIDSRIMLVTLFLNCFVLKGKQSCTLFLLYWQWISLLQWTKLDYQLFTLIHRLSLGLVIVDLLEIVDFLCADGQIHNIKIPLNFQHIFLIVAFDYLLQIFTYHKSSIRSRICIILDPKCHRLVLEVGN